MGHDRPPSVMRPSPSGPRTRQIVTGRGRPRELRYEKLEVALVRIPLLPIESYLSLPSQSRLSAEVLLADPRIRRALALASPSLLTALESDSENQRKRYRMLGKLRRFVIRMSTRPTPFGTFAGVALAEWDRQTDLLLGLPYTSTRIDMDWLVRYVMALDAQPNIRNQLRWVANRSVWVHHGRAMLSARTFPRAHDGVSIAATRLVRNALDLARAPVLYSELATQLLALTPEAGIGKVERVLQRMWELGFLLTELLPPMTCPEPAEWVRQRLAPFKEPFTQFEALLRATQMCDTTPDKDVPDAIQRASACALSIHPTESVVPVQVDMAFELRKDHLSSIVAEEAARVAELLFRLTPFRSGPPNVASYRKAFIARYGPHREVPLLELVHAEWGLGPIDQYPIDRAVADLKHAPLRAQTLQYLVLNAIREGRLIIDLDEELLGRLEVPAVAPAGLPASLDLNLFILAGTPADIESGHFQLMVGPNLGCNGGARNLGRFASLLGPAALGMIERVARHDEAAGSDGITSEIAYLPPVFRSANVTVRHAVRRYEVPHGVSSGVDSDHTVAPDELVVGVRQDRFYVRWLPRDIEVRFVSGHMLNWTDAPPECRLLWEIATDGVPVLSGFDWGLASSSVFLPRVQAGKSILLCAQWRLESFARQGEPPLDSPGGFAKWFAEWRVKWRVPRLVYLTSGDYRLLHDLDDPEQVDELRAELRHIGEHGQCVLQEGLPSPEHSWLPSVDGTHHLAEIVVTLGLRRDDQQIAQTTERARCLPLVTPDLRLRPPGSDWLFLKLYGPRSAENDLISGPIRDFCDQIFDRGLADSWFFVRYADPEPHLRIRFHGTPQQMIAVLLPELSEWASLLVAEQSCQRFAFDTYEREIERYGGPDGIAASETIFAADSRAVAKLLAGARDTDWLLLALLTTHDLLSALGIDARGRATLLNSLARARKEVGEEYRCRKDEIATLLRDGSHNGPIRKVLDARAAEVREAADLLSGLASHGKLNQSFPQLCASYLHMHCNRLWGDLESEQRVIGLLARACDAMLNRSDYGAR